MEKYKIDSKSELPHQQRVIEEANELGVKIEALDVFVNSNPIFHKLEINESERLRHQRFIMKSYFKILKERIDSF
jgi:hypothetical protein